MRLAITSEYNKRSLKREDIIEKGKARQVIALESDLMPAFPSVRHVEKGAPF